MWLCFGQIFDSMGCSINDLIALGPLPGLNTGRGEALSLQFWSKWLIKLESKARYRVFLLAKTCFGDLRTCSPPNETVN